ncbi:MAG: ThuA domain-containing protein [Acidimicrobiales bacterium]
MQLLYVTQVAPYKDGPAGAHGVLGQSATAIAQLADSAGLSCTHVTDVRSLSTEAVASASVIALFTIGETPWTPAQKDALVSGLRAGSTAVVAIHAATDSCYGWDEYGSVVGARFNGHPWTQDMTLDVCEPSHPAVAHLGDAWAWHDEVYQFRDLRPDATVLLRVRESDLDLSRPGVARPSFGFPLSWCFTFGQGRVFSTSLGHFPAAWESVTYLRHLAGGLAWALGGS